MTEDAARSVLAGMLLARAELAGLAIQRLRCVYLEMPEGDADRPSRVRDVRVWRADLWSSMRGAQVTLDDHTGDIILVEYV